MLKILRGYISDESIRHRNDQMQRISSIIKLKRVKNGLWRILDEESPTIEMKNFDKKSNEFIIPGDESILPEGKSIIPGRERTNTI